MSGNTGATTASESHFGISVIHALASDGGMPTDAGPITDGGPVLLPSADGCGYVDTASPLAIAVALGAAIVLLLLRLARSASSPRCSVITTLPT